MQPLKLLVLGAGFTGERVAQRFAAAGATVVRTRTSGGDLQLGYPVTPAMQEALRALPGQGWLVLHSIPLVRTNSYQAGPSLSGSSPAPPQLEEISPLLLPCLYGKASRVVYLSTTGVYGDAKFVDETTPPNARTPREILRLQAEAAVAAGPWSHCILRPAAIYGPGRGAHVSIREGKWKLGAGGDNFVSRIHVEDLASHAEAALLAEANGQPLQGAWPIADEEPSTSLQITEYCCRLFGLPLPPQVSPELLDETRRADRRVDGSAIRRRLGLSLRYPSFRLGIPACLEEEKRSALV